MTRAWSKTGGRRIHAIDALISKGPRIQRSSVSHVAWNENNCVGLSPTQKKIKDIYRVYKPQRF